MFRLIAQPVISSFSPTSGYPRSIVTISGAFLSPTSGNAHVFFGTAKAQVLSTGFSTMTVRVPFGATVGPITISMNGYTVSSTTHFVPTYPASTAAPANLNFFPTEGNLNLTYNGQALNAYNVADLDNDGHIDLVSLLFYSPFYSINSVYAPYNFKIRVYKNISGLTGGITNSLIFSSTYDFIADSTVYSNKTNQIYSLAINDMNSDGNLDIIARTDSGVVIFVNKGLGFGYNMFNRILIEGPDLKILPSNSESITLADFDNNGKIDIAVTGPNSVVILGNYSNNTNLYTTDFTIYKIRTLQRFTTGWKIYSGQITNDDKPDLVFHVYAGSSSNDTVFYLQNTNGITSTGLDSASFTGPTFLKLISFPRTTAINDLNGDGKMDVNTIFNNNVSFQNNLSSSSFSFSPITSISQSGVLPFMPIGDLTGDGNVDLINSQGTNIIIRRNDNSSSNPLSASLFTSTTFTRPLYGLEEMGATCDLDNDGRLDLITSRKVWTTSGGGMYNANLLISRNTYNINPPNTNVTSASYSSLYANSMTITINTPGDGTGRAILLKQGTTAITSIPVNYTYYAATKNYGTSPALADGSKVVYIGDTNVVTITGLSPYTAYKVAILEMNGWANATNFLTSGAYTFSATTLPVKWLSFEGKKIENEVQLNWKTASEINNSHFNVERRFDNESWETIGKVKGNGTTNSISNYAFNDKEFSTSLELTRASLEYSQVYYRIKQVDMDGVFEYSSEISIVLNKDKKTEDQFEATIFPVPFEDGFTIKTSMPGFEFSIFDCSGIELISGESETDSKFIYIPDLAPGIYLANVRPLAVGSNQQSKTMKLIKVN